jgi:hypothetical protein
VRRFSVIFALLALLGPSAASAHRGAPNDGTLAVNHANAVITINARGGVIGHLTDGWLTVKDFNPADQVNEVVTGAERTRVVNEFVTRYWGHDVRFRYIGGRFAITVNAYEINLSAIGRGNFSIRGKGTADDGTFSLNGSAAQPITDVFQSFQLWAAATAP